MVFYSSTGKKYLLLLFWKNMVFWSGGEIVNFFAKCFDREINFCFFFKVYGNFFGIAALDRIHHLWYDTI